MKKLLSLMLALAVVLSLGAVAFAADTYAVELVNGMDGSVVDTVEVAAGEDLVFTISCSAPADMGPTAPGEDGAGVTTTSGTIAYSNITTGGPNAYPIVETVTVSGITADATVTITPNPAEVDGQFPAITMGEVAASGEPSGEMVVPGEYTDGVNTLIIADDMTFSMEKTGLNMDGAEFVLLVTGTVTEDGEFTIDGLFDGDINLAEVATEEQIAADLADVVAVYKAATASGEPSGEAADLPDQIHIDGVDVMGAFTIDVDVTFVDQGSGDPTFYISFEGHIIEGTISQGVWTPASGDVNEQGICSSVQAAYEAMT